MAVSVELLNTTFEDFRGPMVSTFVRQSALLDLLEKKARMPIEGGTYIERTMMTGSPAKGRGVFIGDELMTLQRRKKTEKISVEPHRLVVPIIIPNKELLQNSGKAAVLKLIDAYPQATMDAANLDLDKYMLAGISTGEVWATAEMRGLMTLNGNISNGIGRGVTNGLIDFAAPSAQTDVVQNVAKSQAKYIYNQYGDVANWAGGGRQMMKKIYRKCAHFSGKPNGGPDIILADDDSYENYDNEKDGKIRISVVEDKTEKTNLLANSLGLAEVKSVVNLDRTEFTGAAADGLAYFLNCDWLHWVLQEAPTLSPFVDKIADRDLVVAKFSLQGNLICTKLVAQGAVTGIGI